MERKTLVQQDRIPTLVRIGRMGQQDGKRYIQPFETVPQLAGIIAVL